jgi:2-(1,2-epoxy-1,2-dihydrophenyl)acetyl-CoA isomerase
MNAINHELLNALNHIITAVGDQDGIRCVAIQGAGDNFMAGGDIKKFKAMLDMEPDITTRRHEFERTLHNVHEVIFKMRELHQPIIAIVKGAVAGAGVSLMSACDLVAASEKSFFTLAYCHLGVSPDGGSTYHLPRMVGIKRAFEIALLGDRFDASTAEKWGLINWVFSDKDLDTEANKIVLRLATGPSQAHGHAKALLNESLNNTINTQLNNEITRFVNCTYRCDLTVGVKYFI